MKLKAAQLKKLPDSEFGLIDKNGKRSFPMPDKAHVLQAIKMFKYCPKGKEKELASKINQKAKEYKMKIHAKGAFMKYISPDVMSLSKEASNVGTLEPIVSTNDYQEIHIPAIEDKVSDSDKVIALMANKKIKNTVHTTTEGFKHYKWEIDNSYKDYFNSIYNNVDNRNNIFPTTENFTKTFNGIESIMENKDDVLYMTSSYTDNFIDRANNESYMKSTIESIIKDPVIMDVNKCNIIAHLISNTIDNDRVMYYLLIVNKMDTSKTFVKQIVNNLLRKDYYTDFDTLYGKNIVEYDFNLYKYNHNMKYNMDNVLEELDVLISNHNLDLNELHNKIFNYYQDTKQYFALLELNTADIYAMMLDQIKDKSDINGYYVKEYNKEIYAFCTLDNYDKRLYRALLMYKSNDLVMLLYEVKELLNKYYNIDNLHIREINCSKLLLPNTVDNTFLKGIYFSPDGSICLDIFNRLFVDNNSDMDKLLATDLNTKADLCYIFSIIVLIYNRFVFNKKWDKNSKEYLKILQLKSILENKFKNRLRVLKKNDLMFNFLEYFKNNEYTNRINISDNNGLYNLDSIYSKIIRF